MDSKINLTITTPSGIFFNSDIHIVTLKTVAGYIGLMRNRVPFFSNIEISTLFIRKNREDQEQLTYAIGGGIVSVTREKIEIFTDDIILDKDIDKFEIEKEILSLENKIKTEINDSEIIKNKILLDKAQNKLSLISK